VANREALAALIEQVFSNLRIDDLLLLLDKAGIANSQLNELDSVWNHSQLQSRNRWRKVESPVGQIPVLLPPCIPNSAEPRLDSIPALSADTDQILSELGYSQPDIEELHNQQAV
jgi:crotonobetainyl-CoA:carnitine CoA-transferase CaiB-like acyl-CoA transferase